MEPRAAGALIVLAGIVLVLVGALVAAGAFGWFGRLPGDFRYQSENVRVYAPLASMLVISLVLTVLVAVVRRLF